MVIFDDDKMATDDSTMKNQESANSDMIFLTGAFVCLSTRQGSGVPDGAAGRIE
jgi:hypothetical protein